jgi:hypothetical protein
VVCSRFASEKCLGRWCGDKGAGERLYKYIRSIKDLKKRRNRAVTEVQRDRKMQKLCAARHESSMAGVTAHLGAQVDEYENHDLEDPDL